MSRLAAALAAFCVPLASLPLAAAHASVYVVAPPQGDPEAAEEHRQVAIEAFNGGDLAAAIAAFEKAYEADPSPAYLFNIGRVYEEMGDLENALEYYERFARQPHLTLEERERAGERIGVLRPLVGASTDEGDESDDGGSSTEGDESGDELPPPDPTGADDASGSERPGRGLIIAGSTLLGVGAAVALGGGLGFGLTAADRSDRVDEVEAGENPDGLSLSEIEDLDAEGRSFEILQIVTVAAGGALAVTGASLLAVGLVRRSKAKRSASVQPSIGPRFGGIVLHGRF